MGNVLLVVQVVLAIVVSASILMQKSKADALSGLIQGSKSESFYSKNKGKTKENMLWKLTMVSMMLLMANTVVLNLV